MFKANDLMAAGLALGLVLGLTLTLTSYADDQSRRMPSQMPQAYVSECASCHVAYPPGLLPAASWQRVMQGLDQHYGDDAALDASVTQELSNWLQANAGTYRRARGETPPPEDRITRSLWFTRAHDLIAPDVFQDAAIKSAANCASCHEGAQRGDFNVNLVRIPADSPATAGGPPTQRPPSVVPTAVSG
jgi:mono/diheme cytochrome c family protein